MKHIILIGFKHVGKSRIGQELARLIGLPYRDLDTVLETRYEAQQRQKLSTREIMRLHGESFFRALEHEALEDILSLPEQTVISLGGGAAVQFPHHALLKNHTIVHVTAPKALVYERIMVNGRPAFFDSHENTYVAFERLWNERQKIYEELATVTIANNGSVLEAASKLQLCLIGRASKDTCAT